MTGQTLSQHIIYTGLNRRKEKAPFPKILITRAFEMKRTLPREKGRKNILLCLKKGNPIKLKENESWISPFFLSPFFRNKIKTFLKSDSLLGKWKRSFFYSKKKRPIKKAKMKDTLINDRGRIPNKEKDFFISLLKNRRKRNPLN